MAGSGTDGSLLTPLFAHAGERAKPSLISERDGYSNGRSDGLPTTFTDDVDALHADLVERGIDFFQNPTDQPWGVRTAYFKDPDGHLWEIAQPIQQSPGAPSAGARHTSAPAPGSTSGCAAGRSGSPRTAPLSSTRSRPHQNGTNPRRDQRSAWPGQLSRTQPGVSPPPPSRRGQIRVLHRNRNPPWMGPNQRRTVGPFQSATAIHALQPSKCAEQRRRRPRTLTAALTAAFTAGNVAVLSGTEAALPRMWADVGGRSHEVRHRMIPV